MKNTKIDVRIPFEPDGKLGWDYNRAMHESPHKWVLFLDHDVLLMNPHWYLLCQRAIDEATPDVGQFTCYTNEIGNPEQRAPECPPRGRTFEEHRDYARRLFEQNQFQTTQIRADKCSGMFLLIRKSAWARVGGFPGMGLFREDWTFGKRLMERGFQVRRLDGLYVFHVRDRSVGSWIDGVKTSKEIRDERAAARRRA